MKTNLTYKDWHIYFDPPPIPTRNCDWHFHHKDFDGAGDAYDKRFGWGSSVEDCIDQIKDMEADMEEDAQLYAARNEKINISKLSHNPDAAAWAKAFKDHFPEADECLMLGWFANAMMAMSNHLLQKYGWVADTDTPQPTPSSDAALRDHPVVGDILVEVEKAVRKFPTWPTRIIDAGTVVAEEAGELSKACLQVTYEKDKETLAGVREEAIQTAAMCFRFLLSMDRYDTSPAEQHEQPALNQHIKGGQP